MPLFKIGKSNVLSIPDTHSPFMHRDAISFLQEVHREKKTNVVVHQGDEIDACAISDYVHDPDGMSPGDELEAAIKQLKSFYKAFPYVKVCTSNHTTRPLKRAFKSGLPSKFMRDIKEVLEAPKGWEWQDRWIIDDVVYEHGESFGGSQAHTLHAKANMKSTVIGHIHAHAGIQYISIPHEQFFAMNSGCLIDESAYAFAYAKHMKNKPVLGCGVVLKGVPQFIPMITDKYNRWVGKL